MESKSDVNRRRIVEAADKLFYRQGYNQTSFSDIAQLAKLSRGNFYYYFKSKDEILTAVIERRRSQFSDMLDQWAGDAADPHDRLHRFNRMLLKNRDDLLRYGCPMGSLAAELGKTQRMLRDQARALFEVFRAWLTEQLSQLGYTREVDELAYHLLAMSQGASLVGNVYADSELIEREVARIDAWIDAL